MTDTLHLHLSHHPPPSPLDTYLFLTPPPALKKGSQKLQIHTADTYHLLRLLAHSTYTHGFAECRDEFGNDVVVVETAHVGEWEEGVGYRCRIRRGKVYVVRSRDEMTNGKDRIGRKEKEKEERRRRGELPIEISDSRESSSAEEDVQDDEEEEEEEAPHEIQEYFTTQIRKQKVIGQADAFNDIQALHTAHFILDRETVHKLSLNPYLVNTALNILDTAKHDSDAKDDNGVDQAAKKALNKACSPTNVLASVQMTQLAYLRLNAFPCPDKIRDTIEDKYEDDRELKRRKLSWCMYMALQALQASSSKEQHVSDMREMLLRTEQHLFDRSVQPESSEEWMSMHADTLKDYEDPMRDMVSGLEGFLDLEGDIVEAGSDAESDESDEEEELDEDELDNALEAVLGITRADLQSEAKAKGHATAPEKKDDYESPDDLSIHQVMEAMDFELRGTKVRGDHVNLGDEGESAISDDVLRANLASQLLNSLESQDDDNGPASMLLKSMGLAG